MNPQRLRSQHAKLTGMGQGKEKGMEKGVRVTGGGRPCRARGGGGRGRARYRGINAVALAGCAVGPAAGMIQRKGAGGKEGRRRREGDSKNAA